MLNRRSQKSKALNSINERKSIYIDYWGAVLDLFTHTFFPKRNQVELLPNTQSSSKLEVRHFGVIIRYRLWPSRWGTKKPWRRGLREEEFKFWDIRWLSHPCGCWSPSIWLQNLGWTRWIVLGDPISINERNWQENHCRRGNVQEWCR